MNRRDMGEVFLVVSDVLSCKPAWLFQQAANDPDFTVPARAAKARSEAGLETRPWLQYVNKPQSRPACLMTFVGHTNEVHVCAFSPDSSRIVSASGLLNKAWKLWNAETGVQLWEYELNGDGSATAWSPSGENLAAGDSLGHLFYSTPPEVVPRPRHRNSMATRSASFHSLEAQAYWLALWLSAVPGMVRGPGIGARRRDSVHSLRSQSQAQSFDG